MRSCALAALLVAVGALALAGPVAADQSTPSGVIRVTQSLGDRDLIVLLTPPSSGSGSMDVAVEVLTGGAAGAGASTGRPVRVGVEPVPVDGGTPADTAVVPGPVGVPGRSAVALDRAGTWDVVLADGANVARIPLRWVDPGTPASTWVARIAIALAVAAGIAATTATARRRPRVVGGLATLAAAGVAAGVTAIALGSAPAPAAYVAGGSTAPASTAGMGGMPGMSGMPGMDGGPVTLSASLRASVLALGFIDGSQGAQVDDLTVADEAFVHLAVLGQDGSEQHLHPVRVAPGRWEVRFTPTAAGRYGVFAEFSRDGGNHQLARTVVDVPGPPPAPAVMPGPGVRDLAGMQVAVSVDGAASGRPTRIRAEFTSGGRPVTDLQAWLGMAGHLFVLGPGRGGAPDPADAAASFIHAHDMSPRAAGRGHGPQITFTTIFPEPGRYRLWLQVLRGGSPLTVPVDLDVPGATPVA